MTKLHSEANARRIVACVNALASFTTEQIEQGIDLVELVKQRDKLADDYRAQSLALQAAKSMQAGETERADKAEAQRDRLTEALDLALTVLRSVPDEYAMPDHPVWGKCRAALAAAKGE
ncbi:hypothetical protein DKK66_19740 (plasmid) [Aquitalea sp. USM4]|nr:hypothetical protein DKK66_19740 [Aquitalea sp. USM4]